MSEKLALIIATSQYQDTALRQLVAPAQDAESLARVLGDPAIGGFQVRTLVNEPSHKVSLEIENFCDNRKRDDLLLLYFSCHGIKDTDGVLYFATVDTKLVQHNVRRATAVGAEFVNQVMSRSRSRRQILLLDCCYSGAFKEGMLAKAGKGVGVGQQFEGQGRVVLTASDALQYSFEGEQIQGEGARSVFTHMLVRGLETGDADLDRDGSYSLDEVYDYVYARVSDEQPEQKPMKMGYMEGKIFIGNNPRPRPAELPPELQESLEDSRTWVRLGAVQELEKLLAVRNRGLVLAARVALTAVVQGDDSLQVRTAADKCLTAHSERLAAGQAEAARAAREEAEKQMAAAEKAAADLAEREAEEQRTREATRQRLAQEERQKVEAARRERERLEAERLAPEKHESVKKERAGREKAKAGADRGRLEEEHKQAIKHSAPAPSAVPKQNDREVREKERSGRAVKPVTFIDRLAAKAAADQARREGEDKQTVEPSAAAAEVPKQNDGDLPEKEGTRGAVKPVTFIDRLAAKAAADQERREEERKRTIRPTSESRLPSKFPARTKVVLAVCGVLIVASVLYWALAGSRRVWSTQSSGTAQRLTSVAFATPQSGWAVGYNGIILHTADGGNSWTKQSSGTAQHLTSVAFATPQSGWAMGFDDTILHTADGGSSWTKQSSGTSVVLTSIAFATPQSGWAMGFFGTILHIEDGGGIWMKQSSTLDMFMLNSVAFATPQSGWAVGYNGAILHTEDGGGSWTKQSSGTIDTLNSVAFATPQSGWAVGRNGTILHTEDGGSSWTKQSSGTSVFLTSIAFATPQSGWAVGHNGTILHTEDGGSSWTKQSSGTSDTLNSVAFATPQSGWAVGDNGTILHWN